MSATDLLRRLCSSSDGPPPSTLVVAAHPDDETVSAGWLLTRLQAPTLVHVTDGAPRRLHPLRRRSFSSSQTYAFARRQELEAALALAGIRPEQVRGLACSDQEAAFNLASLSLRTAALLRELRPEVVLTHAYEGGHPDHDAAAFAVHAACRLLEREGEPGPSVVEMGSYHRSLCGVRMHAFLPGPGEVLTRTLTASERALKRRLLACFRTQWLTLRLFPVAVERFRLALRYDFTRPPHPGRLLYECFAWGMTGARFRELASRALVELRLDGVGRRTPPMAAIATCDAYNAVTGFRARRVSDGKPDRAS